MKYFLL